MNNTENKATNTNENKEATKVNLNGLTTEQATENFKQYGNNKLSEAKQDSIFDMFKEAFSDICIIVLLLALGVKVILAVAGNFVPALSGENDIVEIVSIVMAIILATGISVLNDFRNQKRSTALQEEYGKTYAKVMRSGELHSILTSDITMDDVIIVQAGDKIPVDGLVVSGTIKVSQAALNGESRDETKTETSNIADDRESTDYSNEHKVFMGSVVTSGEAYMVATVLGDKTELGKINQSLNESDEDEIKDATTEKLEKLVGQIGKLGTFCGILAGVLLVVMSFVHGNAELKAGVFIGLCAEAVMLAASILIMAIPEGLALIVTLIQSLNSENMYKHNILVSNKSAFADSSFLNILFSDKTGTITLGKLKLVDTILGNGEIKEELQTKEFIDAITYNNLAKISEGKAIGSNNMDRALLDYAISKGFDGNIDEDAIKEVSGFDSEKKCATTEMKGGTVYWKGATENIIDEITHYLDSDSDEHEFTEADKVKLKTSMTVQSERAMKLLSVVKIVDSKKILLAVLCLRDDVRPDAVDTVKELGTAGIQVVMVTGDMKETAVAIAKEAGIIKGESDVVLTHEELENMSDEELKSIISRLRVVSRAKPLDKKRLVNIAQKLGHVVGMTGDGVNDAPALKQADCGFAMGDGTAVAQEAGDVVILNNSLTSIKDCILNARTMMHSINKFLIFQLTVNVSTLLMNVLSPIVGVSEPFSIVEILWINLIMDCLCAISYGGEPVLERYMTEKPIKREANILTPYIKNSIGIGSVFITLVSILILKDVGGLASSVLSIPKGVNVDLYYKTFMFAFFIYSILWNSLNTRSTGFNLFEHLGENKRFVYVMGTVAIVQTFIIQLGGSVFGTTTLSVPDLLIAICLGFLIIPIDMIKKACMKNK